jgi:hypothetical protein
VIERQHLFLGSDLVGFYVPVYDDVCTRRCRNKRSSNNSTGEQQLAAPVFPDEVHGQPSSYCVCRIKSAFLQKWVREFAAFPFRPIPYLSELKNIPLKERTFYALYDLPNWPSVTCFTSIIAIPRRPPDTIALCFASVREVRSWVNASNACQDTLRLAMSAIGT